MPTLATSEYGNKISYNPFSKHSYLKASQPYDCHAFEKVMYDIPYLNINVAHPITKNKKKSPLPPGGADSIKRKIKRNQLV